MALAATAWEKRSTNGSDNNGGGFTIGGTGTDYSQQNAAQQTWDGATNILSTSGAGSTTLASNNALFTAAMVDNIIQITAGTNFQTGFYRIVTFTSSTAVILDRTPSSGGAGSAGVGAVGGALKTLNKCIGSTSAIAAGHIVYDRFNGNTAGETLTALVNLNASGSAAAGPIQYIGYDTTRGDNTGNRPLLTTASIITELIDGSFRTNWSFTNVHFTSTGTAAGIGTLNGNATAFTITNCIFDGFTFAIAGDSGTGAGQNQFIEGIIDSCEIKNCTSAGISVASNINFLTAFISNCYIHGNATGIQSNTHDFFTGTIDQNFITANTGPGILFNATTNVLARIKNNTIYKQTGASDGIKSTITTAQGILTLALENNIIYGNGTSGTAYGVNLQNSTNLQLVYNRNNAYGANFTGARNNLAAGTNDVALTGDPLTSATDPTPNSTAGAGAAVRGAGFPGAAIWAHTGFLDIGCVQHQDAGGGGGGTPILRSGIIQGLGVL